ncbi:Piwi-domain-containing protein, partial [Aureobasidium melanogenum]
LDDGPAGVPQTNVVLGLEVLGDGLESITYSSSAPLRHNSSGQRARLPEGAVGHVSVDDQTVTTRVVSDTERLVNTSCVFNVTTKGAALRGRGEEGALDGNQAVGGSLTHDVVEHRDSLEDAGIVRGLAAQVGVESREVDDGSRLDGDTVTVGTAIASRTTSLFIKVDVIADLVPLLERPGENIAIKDPALASVLLGGLAVPDGFDQATLLSTSADLDLVLVDGLAWRQADDRGTGDERRERRCRESPEWQDQWERGHDCRRSVEGKDTVLRSLQDDSDDAKKLHQDLESVQTVDTAFPETASQMSPHPTCLITLISNTDTGNIQAASERKQCPNLSTSTSPLRKIRERPHLPKLPPMRSSRQVAQDAPSTTPLQLAERDTNYKHQACETRATFRHQRHASSSWQHIALGSEKVESCMALPNRYVCIEPLPASDNTISTCNFVKTVLILRLYITIAGKYASVWQSKFLHSVKNSWEDCSTLAAVVVTTTVATALHDGSARINASDQSNHALRVQSRLSRICGCIGNHAEKQSDVSGKRLGWRGDHL